MSSPLSVLVCAQWFVIFSLCSPMILPVLGLNKDYFEFIFRPVVRADQTLRFDVQAL